MIAGTIPAINNRSATKGKNIMARFVNCPVTGKILDTMAKFAADSPRARKLYTPQRVREFRGISEETRMNPMWRQLSRTNVGDIVVIERLGKRRVYGVSAVLTGNKDTRIIAECISDPSLFASFSWRDHGMIGVTEFRPATEAEIAAALPKPKAPRKPRTVKATAKVVASKRAAKAKGKAKATVRPTRKTATVARARIAGIAKAASAR